MKISIKLRSISDWQSFHAEFKSALGFPDFYGMNMSAWIDCMTHIDDPSSGMTSLIIDEGATLSLELVGWKVFQQEYSEIAEAIVECTDFVNQRFINGDSQTRIFLDFK